MRVWQHYTMVYSCAVRGSCRMLTQLVHNTLCSHANWIVKQVHGVHMHVDKAGLAVKVAKLKRLRICASISKLTRTEMAI